MHERQQSFTPPPPPCVQEAILSAVALPDLEEKVKVAGAKVDEDEARGYFVDDKKHLVVVITVRPQRRPVQGPRRAPSTPRAAPRRLTRASAGP